MGIARRIAELYRAKINALLDWAEDPREMLGYSSGQQREFLRRMRSAAADVAASRRSAGAQERDLRQVAGRLRDQAAQALAAGEEGLGREALIHRAEMIAHADDLAAEQAALRTEEERLAEAARRLEARFATLRYRKEAFKEAYAAAGAATARERVRPSVDVADVMAAARRAEDQAAALRARAEALSQQIRVGGSEPPPSPDFYRIQEQLDALTRDAAVEKELARIRAQMRPRPTKRPPGKDDRRA
jgi:phage shock protein A